MSSKRQRGESSRARPRFDSSKFVSAATETRFTKVIDKKTLVLERGLKPNANVDGDMALMIAERNWFQLVEQPKPAVISLVKEFYANAIEHVDHVVMVRGRPISFDAANINDYFGLETPLDNRFEDDLPTLDVILTKLCKPGTQWVTKPGTDLKRSFPHSALSKYGKAWYAFICARLMPTRHQNDVTTERARLLYGIVYHWLGLGNAIEVLAVDVGLCIQESILRALRGGTTGGLLHGFLITDLCRRAGVHWHESEPLQQPMAIIDHATIAKYKAWEGVCHIREEWGTLCGSYLRQSWRMRQVPLRLCLRLSPLVVFSGD